MAGLQRGIVVAEVALAVFVLVGSALVVRTLVGVLSQPMGFEPDGLLTFRVEPPWRFDANGPLDSVIPELTRDRQRASDGYTAMVEQLRALPGVRAASAVNRLPLTGDWWTTSVRLAERGSTEDSERVPTLVRPATPGYMERCVPACCADEASRGPTWSAASQSSSSTPSSRGASGARPTR